ncbi:MAG: imidazole glycerol phosphate synthase, glutamine amidotransferase subunit [Spirochaetes bacterium RBG_13_68_11]|nr:MAG: imidazole glycerol phosphate synthase, glutamine amidotransferase subunit [Spirochaetes bacterium RBG_13_68_11]
MSPGRVTIVDYGAGNLRSVQNALARLAVPHEVTSDPEEVRRADTVVFPGVGEASSAMAVLARTGLGEAIRGAWQAGRRLIGICLGCQVILDRSEEGGTPCLGLVPGVVRRFTRTPGLKVPHMGWNTVRFADHPALRGVPPGTSFYFVHSYYPVPADARATAGTTEHGVEFASCITSGSLIAFQFHLEKSGPAGLALLGACLAWDA